MDVKALILKHYELYPGMQTQDVVKLLYQNEFGPGHFIADEAESLQRLQEEWASLEAFSTDKAAFEYIGNNLCRLYLGALKDSGISLKTINRFFVNTANSVQGSIEVFEEKLDILKESCKEGLLPYPAEELEGYLSSYRERGYPPVSHSEKYRALYSPAYRVVRKEYCDFFEIFLRIDSLLESKEIVNVAIDGNSGAGKSTLASMIGSIYECNIFHMDDFFLTPGLKTKERLEEAGGNVDYVRFKKEVLDGINSGAPFQYRRYDCKRMSFGPPISVSKKRLNIIEGSYSMHPTLVKNYDLKIFLYIDKEEQYSRILERNGPSMAKRFFDEWIPLEDRYFEELKIKEQSDLVFKG